MPPLTKLLAARSCLTLMPYFLAMPVRCSPLDTTCTSPAGRFSGDLILRSEDVGHSSDVCAYVKNDVGLMMQGGEGPGWTIPKPDLLLCTYAGCATYVKWFEAVSRAYDVPIVFLDVPYVQDEGITQDVEPTGLLRNAGNTGRVFKLRRSPVDSRNK